MHDDPHPLAGKTVKLTINPEKREFPVVAELEDQEYLIEDWWDRLTGGSWMWAKGNPAALKYGMRSGIIDLPCDDEVVYGHTPNHLGHLVHESELGEVIYD
jgi:hypothetical protein